MTRIQALECQGVDPQKLFSETEFPTWMHVKSADVRALMGWQINVFAIMCRLAAVGRARGINVYLKAVAAEFFKELTAFAKDHRGLEQWHLRRAREQLRAVKDNGLGSLGFLMRTVAALVTTDASRAGL